MIVACYKWVVDEADIRVGADLSVDVSQAQGKISDFDRSAIEAAVKASEISGDGVASLTYGTEEVKASFKDALSRGPEKAYWAACNVEGAADGRSTANALALAVLKMDDVKLVVCAEGASDTYARQVGPRMGAVLDWPVVSSVLSFEIRGDELVATRKLEGSLQTVKVSFPAVICVLPEGYPPKAPGLKAIMAAKKKPSEQVDLAELGDREEPRAQRVSLKGYESVRKRIMFDSDDMGESVRSLVGSLRKEGVA